MIKFPRRKEPVPEQVQHDKEKFGLCDPDWVYVPAAATDVTKTWRKFGWKPIEETKEKQDENK